MIANANILLGWVHMFWGRYEAARQYAQSGLTLARQIGSSFNIGLGLFVLGHAALAESALAEAQRVLSESLTMYETVSDMEAVITIRVLIGCVALKRGQPAVVRPYLSQALRFGLASRRIRIATGVLPVLALLLLEQGQIEQAVELYALLKRLQVVARSPWFEDVAGKQIAAAAATLPTEMVLAAQAQGQTGDMWATLELFLAEVEREAARD